MILITDSVKLFPGIFVSMIIAKMNQLLGMVYGAFIAFVFVFSLTDDF